MPLNFLKFDPAFAKDVTKYDVEDDDENQSDPDPRQSVAQALQEGVDPARESGRRKLGLRSQLKISW